MYASTAFKFLLAVREFTDFYSVYMVSRGYSGIFRIWMLRLGCRSSAPKNMISGIKIDPKSNFYGPISFGGGGT